MPQQRALFRKDRDPTRVWQPQSIRGQSLPIIVIDVKLQNKKYFAFSESQISAISHASRPTQKGVGHRHDEGRVAVDADVPLTNGIEAYGKDVWS
jgi:hypothetical protein